MRLSVLVVVLFFLFAQQAPSHAEVFQYFDEQGTRIVTDNPYGVKRPGPRQSPMPTVHASGPNIRPAFGPEFMGDASYDYYPVTGRSFQEAVESAMAQGPPDQLDGKRYPGQTRWNLGWSYKFEASHKREGSNLHAFITIYDFAFRSDVTVLLPRLTPESKLPDHDLKLWDNFVKGLLDHENDHVRITRDPGYQAEALRKISAVRELFIPYDPLPDPQVLVKDAVEAETAKIGYALIRTIKAKNDDYDRVTEHGLRPEMKAVFFGQQ
ncbi:MAG: DUF922 domain-containing protein [Nitrospirae bacterium]|nr:MAG: DUF922 domain-containing protein [Nitrospirota bacterium]